MTHVIASSIIVVVIIIIKLLTNYLIVKNELFNSYLLNRQVHSEVNSVELQFLIILDCSGIESLDSNELKYWKNKKIFSIIPSE